MQTITVGAGDSATWGPVVSPRDPRYAGFNGKLTAEMQLGVAGEPCTVTLEFYNGAADQTTILYQGIDIAPCMPESVFDEIDRHFLANFNAILNEQQESQEVFE